MRIGDLVLFRVTKADLEEADVVHVLDFRQGVTAIAARLAKSLGVPVIYDHEQRGDRSGNALHAIDNRVRHAFIRYGSSAATLVRHTVRANKLFFKRVAPKYSGPFALSPLGADNRIFHRDAFIRAEKRAELGVAAGDFMWLMTGKIEPEKKVDEVARALARHNQNLYLAGDIADGCRDLIGSQSNVKYLGRLPQSEIAKLYNAADCCVFTTFTLSYWEALSSGSRILIPSTSFSDEYLIDKSDVYRFGEASMFEIEEERYKSHVVLDEIIGQLVVEIEHSPEPSTDPLWLSWQTRISELEDQYRNVVAGAS